MGHATDIKKIIVGVDGSDASVEALRRAQNLGESLNARIEAIGCWEIPRMYHGYTLMGIEGFEESADKFLKESVKHVFGPETPENVKVTLMQGDPKSSLIRASNNADLLIVGRRGHGRFGGTLMGSVSSACIAHAKCPVMVVHVPEEDENENE